MRKLTKEESKLLSKVYWTWGQSVGSLPKEKFTDQERKELTRLNAEGILGDKLMIWCGLSPGGSVIKWRKGG